MDDLSQASQLQKSIKDIAIEELQVMLDHSDGMKGKMGHHDQILESNEAWPVEPSKTDVPDA